MGSLNVNGHTARRVAVIVVLVSFSCPFAFPRGVCVGGGGGGALNTHGHNTIHVEMIVDLVSFSRPFASLILLPTSHSLGICEGVR